MPNDDDRVKGPYIRWLNYGSEGWQPDSFATLTEAVEAFGYSRDLVITKLVLYDVVERIEAGACPKEEKTANGV